jgi:diacylglycerol O-acyltransferase 1
VLLIREDESCSHDFQVICSTIREANMSAGQVGRPIMSNSHTGRGVSALSRNAKGQSYRGLVNILVICLVMSNIQNILRTINEKGWIFGSTIYGVFVDPDTYSINSVRYALCLQFLITAPFISYLIEKFLGANRRVPRIVVFAAIIVNMLYVLIYPVWRGHQFQFHPILRLLYMLSASTWLLKLLSYHHIWHDVRYHLVQIEKEKQIFQKEKSKGKKKEKKKVSDEEYDTDDELADRLNMPHPILKSVHKYPSNISIKDMLIFILLPTLDFQLKYPFNPHINIPRFFLRLGEYFLCLTLWIIIILEYCTPLVAECAASFKREDYANAVYYFIRLTVPNTYAWLIMFYGTFHVWLNAFSELTGFADKNFYEDWWNSKTLGEYWRKWNLPVHNWLTRHIYFPLIRRKFSKTWAMLFVFLFSALMHEYLISGVIDKVTLIGFNTMAIQLPFIIVQEKYKKYLGGEVGNVMFWIIFCVIGQPAGMVMGYVILNS